jgi:hypothetical protein
MAEIRRIAPIRAGNIVAGLYAIMTTSMALFMFPMFSLAPLPAPQPGQPDPAATFAVLRWFLLLYPVIGLIFGWLFGFLSAAAYNVLQRWVGGFLIEIEGQRVA